MAGVCLEGHRANEDAAKTKDPCVAEGADDIAGEPIRRRKSGFSCERRHEFPSSAKVVLDRRERGHSVGNLRVAGGTDILPLLARLCLDRKSTRLNSSH